MCRSVNLTQQKQDSPTTRIVWAVCIYVEQNIGENRTLIIGLMYKVP